MTTLIRDLEVTAAARAYLFGGHSDEVADGFCFTGEGRSGMTDRQLVEVGIELGVKAAGASIFVFEDSRVGGFYFFCGTKAAVLARLQLAGGAQ
jgi:hypothetical protein